MFNEKKYQKEYHKKLYENNKSYYIKKNHKQSIENTTILNDLKFNGCSICGYNKSINSLVFHHINKIDKKYQITRQVVTRKDFIDELNKCILLCSNCHGEIHTEEKYANN